MEDPGAFFIVALNDTTRRDGLVAGSRQRPGRGRIGWSAAGAPVVRRAVASVLRGGSARLEPGSLLAGLVVSAGFRSCVRR